MMRINIILVLLVLITIKFVDNAVVIQPVHVRTNPMNPTSVSSAPSQVSSLKPSSSTIARHHTSGTRQTLSSSTGETTVYHSSWWSNRNSTAQTCFRFGLYFIIGAAMGTLFNILCSSKKRKLEKKTSISEKSLKKNLEIATISEIREEAPPSYAVIHQV